MLLPRYLDWLVAQMYKVKVLIPTLLFTIFALAYGQYSSDPALGWFFLVVGIPPLMLMLFALFVIGAVLWENSVENERAIARSLDCIPEKMA